MARALTGNGTGNGGAECFFIDYSLNSQSIFENYSNISWWAYWHFYNSDRQLDNGYANLGDVNRWSNGGRVYAYTGNFTTRDLLVASGSFNLYHNADGTKTMNVAGGLTGRIDQRSEGSSAIVLPTIPRAATITSAPDFNDEANPTVGYSNPAGNAVTSLQISICNPAGTIGYAGYRDASKTGSSYTFNLTSGERAALLAATPESNTMTVRFYIKTVLGGSTYYSVADRTMTVVNNTPVFAATNIEYLDTNATAVAITTDNQKIVQSVSTLRGIFTAATALKSATISSYKVTLGADVRTFSTAQAAIDYGALNISADTSLSIEATDSRGNTATAAKTVTFLPWSTPRATLDISRVNNYEDSTDLLADVIIDSVNSKNAILSIALNYKKTSDPTYTSTTMTTGVIKTITLDKLYEWNIQIIITDKFGNTTYNTLVPKGIPILFIDNEMLNIGISKFPEAGIMLDVGGTIYASGIIKSTAVSGVDGGRFELAKANTNGLDYDTRIDVNQKTIRMFENGGSYRGAHLDISRQPTSGVDTNRILTSGDTYGIKIDRTTDITIPIYTAYGTYATYPFDTIDTNADASGLTLVSSGVKVMKESSFIQLSAFIGFDLSGQAVQIQVCRNGNGILMIDSGAMSGMVSVVAPTFVTPCAKNDIFTVTFTASLAGSYLTRGTRSGISAVIIK